MYRELEASLKALDAYYAAIKTMEEIPHDSSFESESYGFKARCYREIAIIHRDMDEPQKALDAYDEAIKLMEEYSEDSIVAGEIYNSAGRLRYELGDIEGAMRDCRKGLAILYIHLDKQDPIIVKCEEFIRDVLEKHRD